MCMDIHCEDGDEDVILYRDQGVRVEEIKYYVALHANDSVTGEEKKAT